MGHATKNPESTFLSGEPDSCTSKTFAFWRSIAPMVSRNVPELPWPPKCEASPPLLWPAAIAFASPVPLRVQCSPCSRWSESTTKNVPPKDRSSRQNRQPSSHGRTARSHWHAQITNSNLGGVPDFQEKGFIKSKALIKVKKTNTKTSLNNCLWRRKAGREPKGRGQPVLLFLSPHTSPALSSQPFLWPQEGEHSLLSLKHRWVKSPLEQLSAFSTTLEKRPKQRYSSSS